MNSIVKIAGRLINIVSESCTLADILSPYTVEGQPDMLLEISRQEVAVPQENLFFNTPHLRAGKSGGDTCFAVYEKSLARVGGVYADGYKRVKLTIAENKCSPLTDNYLEYAYAASFIGYYMAVNNALMLHGSCIVKDGAALIFTAPSGTGKSTHARLWQERYGDVVVINDDKPIVTLGENIVAHGSPFSGKDKINANVSAPLKAIIYLERAEDNRMERMSVKDALFVLMQETVRSKLNAGILNSSLNSIEKLIGGVPCYRLYCMPVAEAVQAVREKLLSDKIIPI